MSNLKSLIYHNQPYGQYQLGLCTVETSEGYVHILKVLKSKAGHIFCTFVSIKVGENWLSCFSNLDKEAERKLLKECSEKAKTLIESPNQEQQQEPQEITF